MRAVPVERLEVVGGHLLRYGLVAILLYFGAFKFTAVEARAIQPLVANSPLMAWLYAVFTVQGVSNLIGASELVVAGLIALRPVAPRWSVWGSLGAAVVFLTTLSFLVTTPGIGAGSRISPAGSHRGRRFPDQGRVSRRGCRVVSGRGST